MQGDSKKRIRPLVLIILMVLLGIGCVFKQPPEWGKVLRYNKGGNLFYTPEVTEEEARRLGDYLLKIGFFQDNRPNIVQLSKKADVYQIRTVSSKKALEKEQDSEVMGPVEAAGLLAEDISRELFNGAKVEWHLCNDNLKTLRVGKAPD